MFKINGLEINVTGEQLLNDLKFSLNQNGIYLLNNIKVGINNIQFSCPAHKGGQERTPSCGMSIIPTYRGNKEYPAGTVHCFTCGYTATLEEFISYCFGYQDGGILGNKWLKANYRTNILQKNRKFKLEFNTKEIKQELPTIPDEILEQYRLYHKYMYDRGLTDDIIELFDVGYDEESREITFPISNIKGEVKWILRRSIDNKVYKIPPNINKTEYLYGAKECIEKGNKEVWIVESVFNALTLWTLDIPAIALLGTGGGNQYDILKKLPFRHYILALDPDEAGEHGMKRLSDKLDNKLLSILEYKVPGKDINDLREKVLDLKTFPINF